MAVAQYLALVLVLVLVKDPKVEKEEKHLMGMGTAMLMASV